MRPFAKHLASSLLATPGLALVLGALAAGIVAAGYSAFDRVAHGPSAAACSPGAKEVAHHGTLLVSGWAIAPEAAVLTVFGLVLGLLAMPQHWAQVEARRSTAVRVLSVAALWPISHVAVQLLQRPDQARCSACWVWVACGAALFLATSFSTAAAGGGGGARRPFGLAAAGLVGIAAVVLGSAATARNVSARRAQVPRPPQIRTSADADTWLKTQPRLDAVNGFPISVVAFYDYQCPYCKRAFEDYEPVFAALQERHADQFRLELRDYPLDQRCNPAIGRRFHAAACDAAVAVRLARQQNAEVDLRRWLFEHQRELTRQSVHDALNARGVVPLLDDPGALAAIGEDLALAKSLNVRGTPAIFVNGIKVPNGLSPAELELILDAEYRAASLAASLRMANAGPREAVPRQEAR